VRSFIAYDPSVMAALMMHRQLPGLYQSERAGIEASIEQQKSQREIKGEAAAKFSRVSRQQRRAAERRSRKES
jgi:hypothetical protein